MSSSFHFSLLGQIFYSLNFMKPNTKTKNQKFSVSVNKNSTTFLYTLNRGGQENIFLEGEKMKKTSTTKKFGF